MLDPDQSMEADLGIDSIKRMELLGALQKTLPDAVAERLRDNMDDVSQRSSIRAIVEFITDEAGVTAGTENGGAAAAVTRPFDYAGVGISTAVLPRFVQRPFHEPADHVEGALPDRFPVLVTEAADGFHVAVIDRLTAAGAEPTLLPADILASDDATLAAWLDARFASDKPAGLVHLASRAKVPPLASLDLAEWKTRQDNGVKRFFALVQGLAPRLRSGGRIVACMETGGGFGRSADGSAVAGLSLGAGTLGLVKALGMEWHGCSAKVVDLDPFEAPEARAGHLMHELSFVGGRREAGYPNGHRTILRTEPASLEPPHTPGAMIDGDWVVLATGGARGITAECLRTLAPFGPTLVLLGRSGAPECEEAPETRTLDAVGLRKHYVAVAREASEKLRPADIEVRVARHLGARDMWRNIEDFRAMGAAVDYRAVDVSDESALQALIDDVYATYGRIDMLVHGAGIIEDALIEKKTRSSFDRVFDTKVDSALVLARCLRPETLKSVCFFTSVAGRYGNRGQTDYAAANETLNQLAWSLRAQWPDTKVKAINWGPWGMTTTGAGMVTEDVRQQFESRGIGMVEAQPGRDLFFKEMFWSSGDEVEVVAWVADGESLEAVACALPEPPGVQRLFGQHALLRNAQKRENATRSLIWPFDLVTAPYVDHHRFDGVPVLPAAGVVQMISEVPTAFGVAEAVVAVEDFKVMAGARLTEPQRTLDFTYGSDGESVAVNQGAGNHGPATRRMHYKARVGFGSLPPPEPPMAQGAPAEQGLADAASLYRETLSHGPRFQTIERVLSVSPQGVRAELRPTVPGDFVAEAAGTSWSFDPGLLDGMLQMTWIWTTIYQGGVMLPAGIASVRRYTGNVNDGPLYAETRILTAIDDLSPETTTWVYDAQGRACYVIDRLFGQTSRQLNRLRGGWQGGARPPVFDRETGHS